MFGYIVEKETGYITEYWDLEVKPEDTEIYEFIECLEADKPAITKPAPSYYNADELITWATQQGFASSIMAHMAAFLDFANKATQVSYVNFMTYASAVGLTETAQTIVDKAIELGADIGVV